MLYVSYRHEINYSILSLSIGVLFIGFAACINCDANSNFRFAFTLSFYFIRWIFIFC